MKRNTQLLLLLILVLFITEIVSALSSIEWPTTTGPYYNAATHTTIIDGVDVDELRITAETTPGHNLFVTNSNVRNILFDARGAAGEGNLTFHDTRFVFDNCRELAVRNSTMYRQLILLGESEFTVRNSHIAENDQGTRHLYLRIEPRGENVNITIANCSFVGTLLHAMLGTNLAHTPIWISLFTRNDAQRDALIDIPKRRCFHSIRIDNNTISNTVFIQRGILVTLTRHLDDARSSMFALNDPLALRGVAFSMSGNTANFIDVGPGPTDDDFQFGIFHLSIVVAGVDDGFLLRDGLFVENNTVRILPRVVFALQRGRGPLQALSVQTRFRQDDAVGGVQPYTPLLSVKQNFIDFKFPFGTVWNNSFRVLGDFSDDTMPDIFLIQIVIEHRSRLRAMEVTDNRIEIARMTVAEGFMVYPIGTFDLVLFARNFFDTVVADACGIRMRNTNTTVLPVFGALSVVDNAAIMRAPLMPPDNRLIPWGNAELMNIGWAGSDCVFHRIGSFNFSRNFGDFRGVTRSGTLLIFYQTVDHMGDAAIDNNYVFIRAVVPPNLEAFQLDNRNNVDNKLLHFTVPFRESLGDVSISNNFVDISIYTGNIAAFLVGPSLVMASALAGSHFMLHNNTVTLEKRGPSLTYDFYAACAVLMWSFEIGAAFEEIAVSDSTCHVSVLDTAPALGVAGLLVALGLSFDQVLGDVGLIKMTSSTVNVSAPSRSTAAVMVSFTGRQVYPQNEAQVLASPFIDLHDINIERWRGVEISEGNRFDINCPDKAGALLVLYAGRIGRVESMMIRDTILRVNFAVGETADSVASAAATASSVFFCGCPMATTLLRAPDGQATFPLKNRCLGRSTIVGLGSLRIENVTAIGVGSIVDIAGEVNATEIVLERVFAPLMRSRQYSSNVAGVVRLSALFDWSLMGTVYRAQLIRVLNSTFAIKSSCEAAVIPSDAQTNERQLIGRNWRGAVFGLVFAAPEWTVESVHVSGVVHETECDASLSLVAPPLVTASATSAVFPMLVFAAGKLGTVNASQSRFSLTRVNSKQQQQAQQPSSVGIIGFSETITASSAINMTNVQFHTKAARPDDDARDSFALFLPSPQLSDQQKSQQLAQQPSNRATLLKCVEWNSDSLVASSRLIRNSHNTPFLRMNGAVAGGSGALVRDLQPCAGWRPSLTATPTSQLTATRNDTATRGTETPTESRTVHVDLRPKPQQISEEVHAAVNILALMSFNGAAVTSSFRVMSMSTLRSCGNESGPAESPLGFDSSPLMLETGNDGAVATFRGALVGNVVAFLIVTLCIMAAIGYQVVKHLRKRARALQQAKQQYREEKMLVLPSNNKVNKNSNNGNNRRKLHQNADEDEKSNETHQHNSASIAVLIDKGKVTVRWPGNLAPFVLVFGLPCCLAIATTLTYRHRQDFDIFLCIPGILLFALLPMVGGGWITREARASPDEVFDPIKQGEKVEKRLQEEWDELLHPGKQSNRGVRRRTPASKSINSNSSREIDISFYDRCTNVLKFLYSYLLVPWIDHSGTSFFERYGIWYESFHPRLVYFAMVDWLLAAIIGFATGTSLNCSSVGCCNGASIVALVAALFHLLTIFFRFPFTTRGESLVCPLLSATVLAQSALGLAELHGAQGGDVTVALNILGDAGLGLAMTGALITCLPVLEPFAIWLHKKVVRKVKKSEAKILRQNSGSESSDEKLMTAIQVEHPSLNRRSSKKFSVGGEEDLALLFNGNRTAGSSKRHRDFGNNQVQHSSSSNSRSSSVQLSAMLLEGSRSASAAAQRKQRQREYHSDRSGSSGRSRYRDSCDDNDRHQQPTTRRAAVSASSASRDGGAGRSVREILERNQRRFEQL